MLTIDHNSVEPLYMQIYNEIVKMVENKMLRPGESIPTIRQLAAQLNLAPNTVARAYRELEKSQYIVSSGRKGTFINDSLVLDRDGKGQLFKTPIRELIRQGFSKDEIIQIFKSTLGNFF